MPQFKGTKLVIILSGLVALFSGGCFGNDPYGQIAEVTGRVTCGGKPATGGTVIFRPVDASEQTGRVKGHPGRESHGIVGEDGSFSMTLEPSGSEAASEGALVGPHDVTFKPPRTSPPAMHPEDRLKSPEEQKRIQAILDATPVYSPLECGDAIKPSRVDVVDGENEFKFTLETTTKDSSRLTSPSKNRGPR